MSAGHCDPRKIVKRIYKQIKHPELPPKHHIPFIFSLLQLGLPGLCNSSPVPTIYTGHPRTLSSDYRGFLRDGASYRGEEAAGRDSRTPAAFRYPSDEWQTDTQTPGTTDPWISAGSHDCQLHVSTFLPDCVLINGYETPQKSPHFSKKPRERYCQPPRQTAV